MRVKRAIIMAAGKGKRMEPLTRMISKPLIEIGEIPMIESIIQALHGNGITEIYIVVGYLQEQYAYLPQKYSGVRLIPNPYYENCNNISSLYVAREYLADTFIIDGDQVIFNQDILKPEFSRSGYNAVWTDAETGEWLLTVQDGVIRECSRTGGKGGWQLYSVSRWSEEDGAKLKRHLEEEFETNGNTDIYWDDVALFCYPEAYQLGITPMKKEDIIEIDTLQELYEYAPKYRSIVSKEE